MLTALGLGTVSAADDLQTYADQLGITAEQLQLLNFIALQTDVSQESLRKAFIKTKDAIGGQLLGQTSMATKALDALGISANQFSNDTDAFLAIAASLGEVENSAIQASIANDIFGDRLGAQILTLAKAGWRCYTTIRS